MSKDEFIDEELQAIGVPFTDLTKDSQPDRAAAAAAAEETAVDANRTKVPKVAPGWFDQLKGCAKWVAVCGGISALLLFFQANELMAIQAAFPCICACMTLAGYGVGKHTAEGSKKA